MYSFWTLSKNYRGFRQFAVCSAVLFTTIVQGQVTPDAFVNRRPASYIPDDDIIVKPIDNEISFYQRYVSSDKSDDVAKSRNQLKVWNDNQIFAEQYGMDSSAVGSTFYVPTQDEKLEYFKSKYMRYLRAKGEQPLKDAPKNWYNDFRASNEVDTIDQLESNFKKTTKTGNTGSALPEALQAKEVSIWKKTSLIFQPRLDQGLVIVGFKSPIAYARAWVGVNGKTEFNVQQTYEKTGTRFMVNYYADTGKYFTSVDQRLIENVYARVTSMKNPLVRPGEEAIKQDNQLMLLYAKKF
jgi:hypothetical protein